MARHQEEHSNNPYRTLQRDSAMTTFSIPESLVSETLETRSLENIVLSSERPIVIKNPFYKPLPPSPAPPPPPPPPESPWKPWIPKLLIALFSVLGLALVLAVVLVVLAATGYLGKAKVEVIDIVQPADTATALVTPSAMVMVTPTSTATAARALRTLAGGGTHIVVKSSAGKTMKSVGILVAEVMIGWGLVYLFEKFGHRENAQKKSESQRKEKRNRSRSSSSGSSRSRSRSPSRGRRK